jgi:hypothetical protein
LLVFKAIPPDFAGVIRTCSTHGEHYRSICIEPASSPGLGCRIFPEMAAAAAFERTSPALIWPSSQLMLALRWRIYDASCRQEFDRRFLTKA